MKVKKRDGRLQDFSINKIKLTLERVSDELGEPFTGSDLRILTETVELKIVETGKEIIESAEIYKIVIERLRRYGFAGIAKAYEEFEKSF